MKNYGKKLVHGTFIILAFSIISALIGYIFKLVLAKTISVSNIGLFFSVYSFVMFFTFVRDLGLSDSLIYFIPRLIIEGSKAKIKYAIKFTLSVQLAIGGLFFATILFLANYLSLNYFKDIAARELLIALSVYFILDGIHEVLLRSFHGYQAIFFQQGLDFTFQLFSFVFLISSVLLRLPLYFLGIAYILAEFITVVIFSAIFLKKVFPDFTTVRVTEKHNISKPLLENSIPTMFGTFAETGFSGQTVIFLTYFVNLESVAYYFMVRSIAKLTLFLYKASSRAFLPMTSELWVKKDMKKLNSIFGDHMKFTYLIAAPVSVGLFFFSKDVLRLLYGEAFVAGSTALMVLSVFMIFEIGSNMLVNIFTGVGKPVFSRNATYIKVISNIVANLILIPMFGLIGAVTADLISVILAVMYVLYINSKEIKISLPVKDMSLVAIAAGIFLLEIFVLKNVINLNAYLEAAIILALSGVSYVLVAFSLRLITISNVDYLLRMLTNDKVGIPERLIH
jgi:O-antigen/teichoic acid export membrane protein